MKKLLAIMLVCALAMTFGSTAFAEGVPTTRGSSPWHTPIYICPMDPRENPVAAEQVGNLYINVASNHQLYEHVNVNTYNYTGDADQRWIFTNQFSDGGWRMASALDPTKSYCWNIYHPSTELKPNLDLMRWQNNQKDSKVWETGSIYCWFEIGNFILTHNCNAVNGGNLYFSKTGALAGEPGAVDYSYESVCFACSLPENT